MSGEAKAAVQAFAERVIAELEAKRRIKADASQRCRMYGQQLDANEMRHEAMAMDEAIDLVRRLAS